MKLSDLSDATGDLDGKLSDLSDAGGDLDGAGDL
jgi:hypothetical protein